MAALSTARSLHDITDNIACATLDRELFDLLQHAEALDALAETLSTHWLDRGLQDLRAVATSAGAVSRYEHQLRQGAAGLTTAEALPPVYVRDPAFRRVVIELYDYRCAASGVRLLLPTGVSARPLRGSSSPAALKGWICAASTIASPVGSSSRTPEAAQR